MRNKLNEYIRDIESRVKRLEESITMKLNVVINMLNFEEQLGFTDTLTIHRRDANGTFYVGYSELGVDCVGDVRGPPILIYDSEYV